MSLRERLLGSWELVSFTYQDEHGGPVTEPFGPHPEGFIVYTPDGVMSAQLMRPGRPAYDVDDTDGGTAEEYAAAATGYLAYAGWFEVDEERSVVHHRVVVSLLPNWLGTVQARDCALTGDDLTLSDGTPNPDGSIRIGRLHWRRAAASASAPITSDAHCNDQEEART